MNRLTRLVVTAGVVVATGCGTTVHTGARSASGQGDATLSAPTLAPSVAGAGPGQTAPGTTVAGAGPAVASGPGSPAPVAGAFPAGSTGSEVTAQGGPIKVGFIYSLNDAAASAGIDDNQTVNPGNVVHALVADYNEAGGFAGRRIQPVYAELKSSSNDFEGDLAAACASFTQDNHVAAVFVALGFFSESFNSCLARAGVPVISSDSGPDADGARAWPLLVTPDSLLGDTRVLEVVDRLHASGWLTSHDRMGVVIEDCPINQRIYANTLAPELRRLGIPVAATAAPHCFERISDLGTISAEMGSAVVKFRQRRVTKVVFVSAGQEGTIGYEFMLAAGNQSWYPGYALSSGSFATTLQAQSGVPAREFANARGVGWIPPSDTVNRREWTHNAATKKCGARMRGQGLHPSSAVDQLVVQSVCDTFDLYDAALRATHGDASALAVVRGLQRAGRTHVSGLAMGGATSAWDHGRLSPARGRLFEYVSSQGGFVYTGSAFGFGSG